MCIFEWYVQNIVAPMFNFLVAFMLVLLHLRDILSRESNHDLITYHNDNFYVISHLNIIGTWMTVFFSCDSELMI